MEITFKDILESDAYSRQKELMASEINWGDPNDVYIPHQEVFEHPDAEKPEIRKLKKKWRALMRDKWGNTWSKRTASRRHGEFNNRMN